MNMLTALMAFGMAQVSDRERALLRAAQESCDHSGQGGGGRKKRRGRVAVKGTGGQGGTGRRRAKRVGR